MRLLNCKSPRIMFIVSIAAALLSAVLMSVPAIASQPSHSRGSAVATVLAKGLVNPRGLTFGPDGKLYVAEGGYPVEPTTEAPAGLGGLCSAGASGPGNYFGSATGSRISRIDAKGNVETFVDGLPSSEAEGLASGVADVAFIGKTLYAILAGAGCSHGVPGTPNGVIRVNRNGSWTMIANLSAFLQAHPVANPTDPITGDFEPDGTWYSMIAVRGNLYAVEPNHGELDRITPSGKVTRVIDISASQGHVVPTVVAHHGGIFYVSNLGQFNPGGLNTQSVYRITPRGHIKVVATGLSKVLGIAVDRRDRIYVLETSYSATDPGPEPATARLIRIEPNGKQEILLDGSSGILSVPSGMTLGPDGALYISNVGFGAPPIGLGQIVRVEIRD
ncbi:MAG TPA: ScyD/ScyE family protein [Steroidobacteraceae bacterium]|nr:ScyD/ScyE family protein [Steroidobacteraceae bacterium]